MVEEKSTASVKVISGGYTFGGGCINFSESAPTPEEAKTALRKELLATRREIDKALEELA
jgi:hypothetical protein